MSKTRIGIIGGLAALIGMLVIYAVVDIAEDQMQVSTQPAIAWKADFIHAYEARDGDEGDLDPALAYDLLSNAEVLCTYLDEDPSLPYAWTYGTDKLGMSSDQTVVVIEEAIHTKCTQHTHLLAGE